MTDPKPCLAHTSEHVQYYTLVPKRAIRTISKECLNLQNNIFKNLKLFFIDMAMFKKETKKNT